MSQRTVLWAAFTAALALGCGAPEEKATADGGSRDRAAADQEPGDAGQADALADRGGTDRAVSDQAGQDRVEPDAVRPDTSAADLSRPDTSAADQARADAATADAGQVDAGALDQAQADMGAPDRRRRDRADPDTAAQDTAAQDTAATDLGSTDTARPDAGAHDAAVSDRGGEAGACPAAALGAELGRDHLLLGGSMEDSSFNAAPFDLRYLYLAGGVPDEPCDWCYQNCNASDWWGCWQWDQDPPGRYAADLLTEAAAAGAIPMITYYVWFTVAGYVEGATEIQRLQDATRLGPYLKDFRFLCQVMAEDPSITAILHIEPDLWGYGQRVNADPSRIPVALAAAGAAECQDLPDTFAGFARCLVAIARAEAPNVLVGLHASSWGEGRDVLINTSPSFDVDGHAATTASFLRLVGSSATDLIVVEMSDRDAAFDLDREPLWWDATNATLPNFHQAQRWVAALGQELALAPLWWQVPLGNTGLNNTCERFQDNRVDYFFDHPGEFAAGGALGIAFGPGATCTTTAETDDGNFLRRSAAYFDGTPPALCGD